MTILQEAIREFEFSDEDFARVCKHIHRRAGIALTPAKREMVYSRLARRLRARNLSSFKAYLALLDNGDQQEWEAFTNALTTNLTSFFREAHHFEILGDFLRARGSGERVSIWCSASSTGEEPYSIAMTAVEAYGSLTPPVQILATDLDTQVLRHAEQGVYGMDRLERLTQAQLKQFFQRGTGPQDGTARVRPELRRLVTYRQLNLLEDNWRLQGGLDVIFCRNVMIYFDRPTQRTILERFAPLLKADGLLFAGHSESLHHAADLFRLKGRTVYERAGAAARSAKP